MFFGYNVRSSDKVDVSDGGTIAREGTGSRSSDLVSSNRASLSTLYKRRTGTGVPECRDSGS